MPNTSVVPLVLNELSFVFKTLEDDGCSEEQEQQTTGPP